MKRGPDRPLNGIFDDQGYINKILSSNNQYRTINIGIKLDKVSFQKIMGRYWFSNSGK